MKQTNIDFILTKITSKQTKILLLDFHFINYYNLLSSSYYI